MKIDLLEFEKQAPGPEVDYPTLIRFLKKHYEAPERKLQELQRQKLLVRLKKGFYVFNPKKFSKHYRPEVVANLLYGPSYLSLEYALSFYGLIPERVYEMTSVTTAKNKIYSTEVGWFSYTHLSADLYPLLTTRKGGAEKAEYMIATPLKAVLDYLVLRTKDTEFRTITDIQSFFEQNLRLDWRELLNQVQYNDVQVAIPYYHRRRRARFLLDWIERMKR